MTLGRWIGLAVFFVSLYVLWQIRQVILLTFLAVVLASALNGLVRKLMGFNLQRGAAVGVSILGLLGLGVLFVLLIVPPFVTQAQELALLVPKGLDRLEVSIRWLQAELPGDILIDVDLLNDIRRQVPTVAGELFRNFFAIFSNSLLVLLNGLLVVVLTLMFMLNPGQYRQIFIRLFPSFYRRRVDFILRQCEVALDNWIAAILFNMAVIAIFSGLGLWILGVKLVLANALIAGLLEAIPNIGPTLSVIPPLAIALLDSPWKALAVLILYVIIQQLEQYLLVPIVMAKQVSLLPAITLLSQVIFAIFFGFTGLLLALPLVIVGQIWIKEVLVKDILDRWHGALTLAPAADPPPADPPVATPPTPVTPPLPLAAELPPLDDQPC
uniref:AI-2E family transporter n=1 Tax=Petrachloros mirabilis TaxID=2918835 RepID=UPI001EE80D89|nr:AI-2E family transporter [Petrachloros mirabilis]